MGFIYALLFDDDCQDPEVTHPENELIPIFEISVSFR